LAEKQHASVYGYFVASLLSIVYTFNFLDRQVIATLAPSIQHDLHLTNTELGNLQGLYFALFYTFWGVPLAWMADRGNRVRIVAFACTAWSLFSVACGLAQTYPMLVAARMGVGVGEAGGSPPSYALLADYFPPTRRSTALAIYSLGVPFGTGLGAAIGALVAHKYGWRVAFFVVGAPGILLALLTLILIREPRRGGFDVVDAGVSPTASFGQSLADFLKSILSFLTNGTLLCTGIGAGLSAFVGYGVLLWAPSLLQKNLHMPAGSYALYYGLVSATAGAVGTFGSGWIVDRLSTLNKAWYAWLPAIVYVLSVPFFIGFVLAGTWQTAIMFIAIPYLFNNMYLAPALAVVQNAVPPARRAISSAVLLFLLNLIGLGGGPTYVGWMADNLKPVYGLSPLQMGLIALVPIIGITVVSHLISGWAIGRDTLLAKAVEGVPEPLAV
jgi:MFS family permease